MKKKVLLSAALFVLFSGVVSASSINGDYKGNPIVKVKINSKEIYPEVPAMIIDGVTMVPLRAVTEALGAAVLWNDKTYTVNIIQTTPTVEPQPAPTNPPSSTQKIKGPLSLYSSDGKIYLGKLTANTFDLDSIYNEFGTYGSKFATNSIFNEFGTYGSKFSSESAFNQLASDPPIIVDGDGNNVGRLTTNSSIKGGVSPIGLKEFLIKSGY